MTKKEAVKESCFLKPCDRRHTFFRIKGTLYKRRPCACILCRYAGQANRGDIFPIDFRCIQRSCAYFRFSRQQIPFMPNGIVPVQEEHSERLSALGREGCIPNRYPLFSFICAFPQYPSIQFPVIKYFPAAFRCSSPKRGLSSQRCECVSPNELKRGRG